MEVQKKKKKKLKVLFYSVFSWIFTKPDGRHTNCQGLLAQSISSDRNDFSLDSELSALQIDAVWSVRDSQLRAPVPLELWESKGDNTVDCGELTCHVAVDRRGPQRAAPIWINGVKARGAANQLIGLAGRLVYGWKAKTVFPLGVSTETTASCWLHCKKIKVLSV